MNISDSRKIVLSALKEVPYEIAFQLSDATQDPNIKNRYWFEFPNQWSNIPNKDAIIGIRSLYLTKTNRYIQYSYKVELIPLNESDAIDTVEGTVRQWLDGSDTIRPIAEFFNERWLPKADESDETHLGTRTHACTDQQHTWEKYEVMCYYGFDRNKNKTNLCFGRGILATSTTTIINGEDLEEVCEYKITITPESDDAKALFGSADPISSKWKLELPIWSRYQCLVKSSLANDDKNNILGHTRDDSYVPIKYFRLNNNDKRFWIELYETRFPTCPVSLPTKTYSNAQELDRDDFIIEAIVAFSSDGML